MQTTIAGVTITTTRPLPADLIRYMESWANDPIWDVWQTESFAEYEPELRAYGDAFQERAEAKWQARIADVSNLHSAKIALLRGDYKDANARAAIAQAEAANRQADALERLASAVSYWLQNEVMPADETEKVAAQRGEGGPTPDDDDDPFGDDPALAEYRHVKAQAIAYMRAERGESNGLL